MSSFSQDQAFPVAAFRPTRWSLVRRTAFRLLSPETWRALTDARRACGRHELLRGERFRHRPLGRIRPHTPHSLAIGFDAYNNGPANDKIGIHLWINGTHAAVSPVNRYTNGFPTLVQIRYTPAGKLSVTYGGQSILNDLTTPGFTLQPGDRYAFGAKTGGATEVCTVDDVVISPQ